MNECLTTPQHKNKLAIKRNWIFSLMLYFALLPISLEK